MPDSFSEEDKAKLRELLKYGRGIARGAAQDAVEEAADRMDPLLVPRTQMGEIARQEVLNIFGRLMGEPVTDNSLSTLGERFRRALKFPEAMWTLGKWLAATIIGALATTIATLIIPGVHH